MAPAEILGPGRNSIRGHFQPVVFKIGPGNFGLGLFLRLVPLLGETGLWTSSNRQSFSESNLKHPRIISTSRGDSLTYSRAIKSKGPLHTVIGDLGKRGLSFLGRGPALFSGGGKEPSFLERKATSWRQKFVTPRPEKYWVALLHGSWASISSL